MTTQTFKDKQKTSLIKKFHTLLGQLKIDNETKEVILESYGVESSRDLSASQLIDLCDSLDRQARPELGELDRLRKRLMAAIGGWLKSIDRAPSNSPEGGELIKAIACRASKYEKFNQIPKNRLVSLYHGFVKMRKDMAAIEELTMELITNN